MQSVQESVYLWFMATAVRCASRNIPVVPGRRGSLRVRLFSAWASRAQSSCILPSSPRWFLQASHERQVVSLPTKRCCGIGEPPVDSACSTHRCPLGVSPPQQGVLGSLVPGSCLLPMNFLALMFLFLGSLPKYLSDGNFALGEVLDCLPCWSVPGGYVDRQVPRPSGIRTSFPSPPGDSPVCQARDALQDLPVSSRPEKKHVVSADGAGLPSSCGF